MTYQPASRYWAFECIETAIYLALALLLAGLCFLRIRPGRPAAPDIPAPADWPPRSKDPRDGLHGLQPGLGQGTMTTVG